MDVDHLNKICQRGLVLDPDAGFHLDVSATTSSALEDLLLHEERVIDETLGWGHVR